MQSDLDPSVNAEALPYMIPPLATQPGEVEANAQEERRNVSDAGEVPHDAPRRRRSWPLPYIAFGLAALLGIMESIAIALAAAGHDVAATVIAQSLMVVTVLPFALGLFVAIRGPHRMWGITAMLVSLAANPFILTSVLTFFGDH